MNASSRENEFPPGQFSLRRLFAAITCIAATFGLAHWFGAAPTAAILFVLACAIGGYFIKPYVLGSPVWNMFAFGLSGSLLLLVFILPAFQSGSKCSRTWQCRNNLKMIALGLQNYADINGCFPPAYLADASGKPMHSWRVLILPYIEQKPLYDQYDFSEPWDGPHNRMLAKQVPPWLQCPSDPSLPSTASTSYVAVTGPETIWAGETGVGFNDIGDGTSNTLAVVEIANSGINWMEPRDLPFSAVALGVNPSSKSGISSAHPGMAQVVFCDGHAMPLESTISVKTLKALATKSGRETIDEEY